MGEYRCTLPLWPIGIYHEVEKGLIGRTLAFVQTVRVEGVGRDRQTFVICNSTRGIARGRKV